MRIKRGFTRRRRHKKILKQTKGYYGAKSKLYRVAHQAWLKSGNYAYVGRKRKKREFRQLWIARINAATRANDLSYSRFMYGLKLNDINLNRKVLADMAVNDPEGFKALCDLAKSKLEEKKAQ